MTDVAGKHSSQEKSIRTSYQSHFAPDAIIAAVVGLGILLMGLVVVVRAGLSGPIAEPVVQILGFDHTATLGLIEVGIGLLLLASAAMSSRSGEIFFGAVLGIAGLVAAIEADSFDKNLAIEPSMGWIVGALGLVTVTTALIIPRFSKKSTEFSQS